MLYVGNFSYTDADEDLDNLCLMPALVEAPDADTALELFSQMLRDLHDTSDLVRGAKDVYLDSLVELDELPSEPLVIQWQKVSAHPDGMYSTLSALPGNEDIAGAYAWGADEELIDLGAEAEEAVEDEDEEISPEEIADMLSDAFKALTSDGEVQLDTDEEAFISFE